MLTTSLFSTNTKHKAHGAKWPVLRPYNLDGQVSWSSLLISSRQATPESTWGETRRKIFVLDNAGSNAVTTSQGPLTIAL